MGLVLLGVLLVSIVIGLLVLLPARIGLLARRRIRERRYGSGPVDRGTPPPRARPRSRP